MAVYDRSLNSWIRILIRERQVKKFEALYVLRLLSNF